MESSVDAPERRDRLLPLIAAERGFRAILLLAAGIVLITHPHTNWASDISHLAQKLGFDPNGNWLHKLIDKLGEISPSKSVIFGAAALGYGVLEGAEAYGLWLRKRWGEWLTVIATSLLFIPEIWELSKSLSPLKLATLLVNIAVVLYLLSRLRED